MGASTQVEVPHITCLELHEGTTIHRIFVVIRIGDSTRTHKEELVGVVPALMLFRAEDGRRYRSARRPHPPSLHQDEWATLHRSIGVSYREFGTIFACSVDRINSIRTEKFD